MRLVQGIDGLFVLQNEDGNIQRDMEEVQLTNKGEIEPDPLSNKAVINEMIDDGYAGKAKKIIQHLPIIQEKVDTGLLLIEQETLHEQGRHVQYKCKMKQLPETLEFTMIPTRYKMNLQMITAEINDKNDSLELKIPLFELLKERLYDHLIQQSKYRLRLLYDPRFDFRRKHPFSFKKGDRVTLHHPNTEMYAKGIIQSFFLHPLIGTSKMVIVKTDENEIKRILIDRIKKENRVE